MAYWSSHEPEKKIKEEVGREEPYATWLREFYSELEGKEARRRLAVPRPVIVRGDDKKYRWINFGDVVKAVGREPSHVASWLGSETSRTDLLMAPDGSTLCFPKRITEGQLGTLLTTYLKIYVLCPKCHGGPTILTKEPALRKTLMACVSCGDLGAMPPILRGYHARTKGERRRERRK
jgi:translation initiation factor 2 beta subunit (eIF-2beta)/eIF-5